MYNGLKWNSKKKSSNPLNATHRQLFWVKLKLRSIYCISNTSSLTLSINKDLNFSENDTKQKEKPYQSQSHIATQRLPSLTEMYF